MTSQLRTSIRSLSAAAADGIATNTALLAAGVSASTISARCSPGGPWRRLLPGVILLTTAAPTRRQLVRAAVAFAGPEAVVTGFDALLVHGVRPPPVRDVRLLVPQSRRLSPRGFLTVERTTRLPDPVVRDGLPFAPVTRAVTDYARVVSEPGSLQGLLSVAVGRGLCTQVGLSRELDEGNQRGTAAVRQALRRMPAGTVLHGLAHRLLRQAPIPQPRWNVTVHDRRHHPVGHVDAWWDEVCMAWLLEPAGGPGPARPGTDLALIAAGVIVVRTPEHVLRGTGDRLAVARVVRELTSAFLAAARRPRPRSLMRCPALPSSA